MASTSAIAACWISWPRWMITTSSTVCATSASTWLEMRTVPPSRPAPGAGRATSECPAGRARSPARRGRAPRDHREGPPRVRDAAACRASSPSHAVGLQSVSSTSASSSSTRGVGIRAAAARTRRWFRPERPGCASNVSRRAPTCCNRPLELTIGLPSTVVVPGSAGRDRGSPAASSTCRRRSGREIR